MKQSLTRQPPDARPAAPRGDGFAFEAHVELLRLFLTRRRDIVDAIEPLLNAQRKPVGYLQDGPLLSRQIEDCFFTVPGVTDSQSRLRGQLEEAHWARGFKPRDIAGLHNSLIDPGELMIRAFHLWRQTQWPGRNGRLRYAQTLFNVYVIRSLALLSMCLWDKDGSGAGERLSQVQHVLDTLWKESPTDHPVLVRDARWLVQLAQSPATDDLGAYFDVARHIAETLSREDRIAIHTAGVRMAGGHLRSQLHYYSTKRAVPLNEDALVSNARTTNALDLALLIQELVPLLDAYEEAWRGEDGERRRELADAILQGISPDPDLFLNRVELLGAYSMIEHLFLTTDPGGHTDYTPMGRRHVQLIQEYTARIGRVSQALYDDARSLRPVAGTCSPYGILYGFTTDLVEHMALKTLQREAVTQFSLDDVFVSDASAEKLAWVSGWRRLPHVPPEVQKLFEYPQKFAEDIFERVERALRTRVSGGEGGAGVPAGRLFLWPGEDRQAESEASRVPDLPVRHIGSSDMRVVAAQKAHFLDEPQLLSDRREGRCIISYRTPGGWVAISKAILTEVLGTGRDVKLVGLPAAAAGALKLMCPDLVVLPENVPPPWPS